MNKEINIKTVSFFTSIQRETLSILRVEYVSFRYIFRPTAWLAMDGRMAALSEAAPKYRA